MQEREMVVGHIINRGLQVDASSLLPIDGAQHGLTTTAMALLKPGDVVAAESLSCPDMKVLAESLCIELAPIPAANAGPDLVLQP